MTNNGGVNFSSSEGTKQPSLEPAKKYSSAKTVENAANNIRLALSQPILLTKDGSQASEPFPRASCGSGVMNRSDVFLRSSIHSVRKRS